MAGKVTSTVRLEAIDADGKRLGMSELAAIVRDPDRPDGSDFGLKLAEGKAILEQRQARIAQDQVDRTVMKYRSCAGCGARRPIHDYQSRKNPHFPEAARLGLWPSDFNCPRGKHMKEVVFYTNPQSRGRIVHWMLEEIGAPYAVEVEDYGTTMKAPDYLNINPMGKVPGDQAWRGGGDGNARHLRLSR